MLANLSEALPIFRPGTEGGAVRTRQMRRDHAQNIASVVLACIPAADWSPSPAKKDRGGYIAWPVPSGTPGEPRWERNDWKKVGKLAFMGFGDDVSLRRVERVTQELTAAGWLYQVRKNEEVAPRTWRGRASLKWVTIKAIKALGLYNALQAHWRWREKQSARERAAKLAELTEELGKVRPPSKASPTPQVSPAAPAVIHPPPHADPPRKTSAEAIDSLKQLFRI